MTIKQAKEYIKSTVNLYLKKDEFGEYRIPVVRQRPIFLLGAPGVGKTAVMEQIAQELGIALVSYSMTHHTRQSALGLPFIEEKEYEGKSYRVSEYTMSEIIASIYDVMRESGIKEGILFLDEINCVSETLAPSMLQFLQYKVFGKHKVPEGWVIVTAGNPPEYNKSVREFDVVTMDRLKVLDVEAEYSVWKEYAQEQGIHNVITSYLELKKEHFYRIETTVKGRSYVTARGWEDLSQILYLYEEEGLAADEALIGQYLRNDRIVKEFAAYYDLYNKYKKNYHVEDILAGKVPEDTIIRAKAAAFDERLSLLSMLMDKVLGEIRERMENADYLNALMPLLKAIKNAAGNTSASASANGTINTTTNGTANTMANETVNAVAALLEKQIEAKRKWMDSLQTANALSDEERRKHKRVIRFLERVRKEVHMGDMGEGEKAFLQIKKMFDAQVGEMKADVAETKEKLHALFVFTKEAFGEENEMLILVTELTVNTDSARFIGMFGCEDYQKYNGQLRLSGRQEDLRQEIEKLEL
ncbi:MAG: AAA family ATPase [Kineothrix sp.]|nr:AAA family ATPase [Kineothrix sp.]